MNAATENTVIETNASETNEAANTEQNHIAMVLENQNRDVDSLKELVSLNAINSKFYETIKTAMQRFQIATNAPVVKESKTVDLSKIQTKEEFENAFRMLEEQQTRLSKYDNIRNAVGDVSREDLLVAFAAEIRELANDVLCTVIEDGMVDFPARGKGKGSSGTKTPSTSETITFTYDKKEFVVKVGKGPMGNDLKPIAAEHAKATGNADDAKKANFIEALKAGKVKGAKITETKGTNAAV